MVETVTDETAANRENRDIAQRGVENKYTAAGAVSVRDGGGTTLTTVAATATGGRTDREYLKRVDHRNDYEYVDYATGTSALSSAKSSTFDVSKANTGLYPF
jgi:hypothetical protein